MPRNRQPRLLPALEPIGEDGALSIDALTIRYLCRCGNTASTGLKLESITCMRCGLPMKPVEP